MVENLTGKHEGSLGADEVNKEVVSSVYPALRVLSARLSQSGIKVVPRITSPLDIVLSAFFI